MIAPSASRKPPDAEARRQVLGRAVSRYAALGDSFTAGKGCDASQRFADRLAVMLRPLHPSLDYSNFAGEGATSERVLAEQLDPALRLGPDLVTLICGANDVLESVRPDIDGYASRLAAMLDRLRARRPGVAIVTATCAELARFLELGPRTRERVSRGVRELNAATLAISRERGVPCLEMGEHPGIADRRNFGLDGFHPSSEGHRKAALVIATALNTHFGIQTQTP